MKHSFQMAATPLQGQPLTNIKKPKLWEKVRAREPVWAEYSVAKMEAK